MTNPFANPVFSLDIRSRVRERRLWILAVFFVLTPLALSLIALMLNDPSKDPFPSMGAVLSGFALFSHGALLVLMSALGAAQRGIVRLAEPDATLALPLLTSTR